MVYAFGTNLFQLSQLMQTPAGKQSDFLSECTKTGKSVKQLED